MSAISSTHPVVVALVEERDLARASAVGQQKRAARLQAERDKWIRAFNRLEAAITHHKRAEGFPDSHDEGLYKARDKILADVAAPEKEDRP